MSNDSAGSKEEFLALYNVTVSELQYLKSNEWSVTNYVFLLLAALVGVRQLAANEIGALERVLLSILAIAIAVARLAMLFKLEQSIRARQSRLDAVRERLSPGFNQVWSAGKRGPEYFRAIMFLRSAIVIGAAIVVWVCGAA